MRRYSILLISVLSINVSLSLPLDPKILEGTVKISKENFVMEIDTGHFAHVEWKSFDISEEETVRFLQEGKDSLAINHILSTVPTLVFGRLEALGKIVLINPNGVLFGETSQVNVGSLVASTLDLISHQSGELILRGQKLGQILNQGTISTRGPILLIGEDLKNEHSISASNVFLISTDNATVATKDFSVSYSEIGLQNGLVANLGNIFAKQDIRIEALNATVQNSGTLVGSGSIEIFGNENFILPGSTIRVNGADRAGSILIGRRGATKSTFVDSGALLFANAEVDGNGGEIVLWGDETTSFYGRAEARGGPMGGNGGFVEVSSPLHLIPKGFVDTSAPKGSRGTLLFDPCTVIISNDPTSAGVNPPGPTPPCPLPAQSYTFGGLATANISIVDIKNYLICNDVTVNATASGTGPVGSITLNADADTPAGGALLWLSGGTGPDPTKLTLIADGFIDIRNELGCVSTTAGASEVVLEITAPIVTIGDPSFILGNTANAASSSGQVVINASNSLNVYGNDVSGTGGILAGQTGPGSVNITTGNLNILSGTQDVGIEASSSIAINCSGGINIQGGTATNPVSANASIRLTSPGNLSILSSGDINLTGGSGDIDAEANISVPGGSLFIESGGNFNLLGGAVSPGLGWANIYSYTNPGTVELRGQNFFLEGRVPNAGTNEAYIGLRSASTGTVTITATGSQGIVLTAAEGGSASISTTPSSASGDIFIQTSGLEIYGSSTVFGQPSSVAGVTARGNISIDATDSILLRGGDFLPSSSAQILSSGIGSMVTIRGRNLEITGGSSAASFAFVQSQFGGVTIELSEDCTLTGGSSTFCVAAIVSAFVGGTGDLNITARNYAITGGPGLGAQAGFLTGDPNSTGGDGDLNLVSTGAQGIALTAGTNTAASGMIATYGPSTTNSVSITGTHPLGSLVMTSTDSAPAMITTLGGQLDITMSNNLVMNSTPAFPAQIEVGAAGSSDLTIRLGNSAFINSEIQNLGSGDLTIAVDENFPEPFIGTGSFNLGSSSLLLTNGGTLRIFTAQQSLNSILGTLNGLAFSLGPIFVDTNQEVWCVYYPADINGVPFTVFYKDCLQLLAEQAEIVITEQLVELQPYNSFPGWWKRFTIGEENAWSQPYFITVRSMSGVWLPKSYTTYLHSTMSE